jgi:hypothetical protein
MAKLFLLAGLLPRGGFCVGDSLSAEGMVKSWKIGGAVGALAIVSRLAQCGISCDYQPKFGSWDW